ncbi:hypothetical protein VNI00_004547 [Paramarasmius palmivorus]|uniref:F-box domain-containing protein n=1 Tax=Paramarasmius palmivorus TaxID=297713 RepID=A0AAW0DFD5_9AGAR
MDPGPPSNLDVISQIDAKLAILDKQIQALRQDAQSLNEERNARMPIARFTPETLIRIFSFCIPSPHDTATSRDWFDRAHIVQTLRCFSFSRVCRTWRRIALNCSSLWTCPQLMIPKLAEAMVERSKPAFLDLCINVRAIESVLPLIKDSFPRTRSLYIQHSPLYNWENCLLLPVPSLTSLEIQNTCTRSEYMTLPENLFGGETPQLARVILCRCYLPWNTAVLGNVTVLSLTGDGYTNIPSGTDFLTTLQGMPRLEELQLMEIFPNSTAKDFPVHTPHLRFLSLMMSAEACANVLHHILLPAATSIVLSCYPSSDSPNAFSTLFSHLSRLYSPSAMELVGRVPFKSLALDFHITGLDGWHAYASEEEALNILAWDVSDIAFPARGSSPPPPPKMNITIRRPDYTTGLERGLWDEDMIQVLEAICFDSVETLFLEGVYRDRSAFDEDGNKCPSYVNFLPDFLGTLSWSSCVKTLYVWGSSMAAHTFQSLQIRISEDYIEDVLGINTKLRLESSAHEVVFSDLQTLALFAVHFGSGPEELHLEDVLDSARFRVKHGLEVPKLVLSRSQVDPRQLRKLRKKFPIVEWDGVDSVDTWELYHGSGMSQPQ